MPIARRATAIQRLTQAYEQKEKSDPKAAFSHYPETYFFLGPIIMTI
jgi:hypothetical protein